MPLIKKILFPVDFSESCFGAARYVEALAGRFEAEIMLLHIVGMAEHNLPEDLLAHRKAELDAFMADEFKFFTTERLCIPGDAAPEIVEEARRWGADLVMMPSHGSGVFRRLLIGSVAAKVLHDLDCPVWTSAHAETAPALEQIHCRRVLCALDLSQRSRAVLDWAAGLASEYQAPLGIVHATEPLPPAMGGWAIEEDFVKAVTERATRELEVLQTAAGTKAQVFIGPGDPAKVVADAAREFDADLIVMGRHSGAGVAGYLRQHAYAILRESPCPVISI